MSNPNWVRNRRSRPSEYLRLYDDLKSHNGSVKNDDVSALLRDSGLQSEHIRTIRYLVNGNNHGDLTEEEFTILLALVAAYQGGTPVFDLKNLFKLTVPKTPMFTKGSFFTHHNQKPDLKNNSRKFTPPPKHIPAPVTITETDDDEFTDFQCGITSPQPTQKSQISTTSITTFPTPQKSQSQIFSPIPMYKTNTVTKIQLQPNDVGNRLANYNFTLQPTRENLLMGDEDKYSALRLFVNESDSGKNEDKESDFGDFQTFSKPVDPISNDFGIGLYNSTLTQQNLQSQINIQTPTPVSIAKQATPTPKIQSLTSTTDDFGDFVSFCDEDETPPLSSSISEKTSSKESHPDLSVDLLGLKVSSISRISNPPPQSTFESHLTLSNLTFPKSSQQPPPLRTTFISGPVSSLSLGSDFRILNTSSMKTRELDSKNKILDIGEKSPETISVASLDLGNYEPFEILDVKEIPGLSSSSLIGNITTVGNVSNIQSESTVDKYSPFVKEKEKDKQKCIRDWSTCLETCVRLLEEGERIFTSASSSQVIRHVLEAKKGDTYISGLREIYLVGCRIYESWMRLGKEEKTLGELHQKLRVAWDSFVPFIVGTRHGSVEIDRSSFFNSAEEEIEEEAPCGICLASTQINDDEDSQMSLDYEGTLYHLQCANLWLNEISPILPTLGKDSIFNHGNNGKINSLLI